MKQRWKRTMQCLRVVPLADKCLLVMMAILLFQSGHTLFSHELALQESDVIDVVIRTTSAAIFGYLISANFLAGGRRADPIDAVGTAPVFPVSPPAELSGKPDIGFPTGSEEKTPRSSEPFPASPPERENRFQVLVVALIGVVALLLLIVARDNIATNRVATATLSQLRDFVSGSVGFLLGHTTHLPKSPAV